MSPVWNLLSVWDSTFPRSPARAPFSGWCSAWEDANILGKGKQQSDSEPVQALGSSLAQSSLYIDSQGEQLHLSTTTSRVPELARSNIQEMSEKQVNT